MLNMEVNKDIYSSNLLVSQVSCVLHLKLWVAEAIEFRIRANRADRAQEMAVLLIGLLQKITSYSLQRCSCLKDRCECSNLRHPSSKQRFKDTAKSQLRPGWES